MHFVDLSALRNSPMIGNMIAPFGFCAVKTKQEKEVSLFKSFLSTGFVDALGGSSEVSHICGVTDWLAIATWLLALNDFSSSHKIRLLPTTLGNICMQEMHMLNASRLK